MPMLLEELFTKAQTFPDKLNAIFAGKLAESIMIVMTQRHWSEIHSGRRIK